jgi:Tfp pilus assembly protein PilV
MLELMFAGFVLVVGMMGSLMMIIIGIQSNTKAKVDTTGTMLAQMVLEEINSQSTRDIETQMTISDCASGDPAATTGNNSYPLNIVDGSTLTSSTTPVGPVTMASLVASTGTRLDGSINFSQAVSTSTSGTPVPFYRGNGYNMLYHTCGGTTYDVRWRIDNVVAGQTRLITVSARHLAIMTFGNGAATSNLRLFAPPVTLRTISGP